MATVREIVPHTHIVGVGFISPSIEVVGGHYHILPDGSKTSTDADSAIHTHNTSVGRETSPPIALEDVRGQTEAMREVMEQQEDLDR